MKKEQIYVTIDSEEKRLRAIEILEKAREKIRETSFLYLFFQKDYKHLCIDKTGEWSLFGITHNTEITLDELEALLIPNYQVKDVILSLDELKQQAEKLGYDLVEKPYEPYVPKVGDFGAFSNNGCKFEYVEFLDDIRNGEIYMKNNIQWHNFRKLTDEEKQKIQESW
jgi:hypothetical protein